VSYLKKRKQAFYYAIRGLKYFISDGAHAKIMLCTAALVLLLGVLFSLSYYEWLTILICTGLVLSLEALNSALEYLVDLASPKFHLLAQKAKDTAAGAVLIVSFISALIGLLIFAPKIISFYYEF